MRRPKLLAMLLDVLLATLLFTTTDRLFRESTGLPQTCDSAYSLVVAEKLLTANTADVSANIPTDAAIRQRMHAYAVEIGLPYQFVRHVDPRHPDDPPAIYYGYPLGSTVLSLPFVRHYTTSRGLTMFRSDGQPNLEFETLVQQRIASRISAAIVVLLYVICRFFCSPLIAALLALGFGLGSPVWSTLSRSLWSHTWMVFCLCVAIVMLLLAKRRTNATLSSDVLLGIGLGTALFWMTFTRPHAILSAGPIGLFLVLHFRRMFTVTAIVGAGWVAALVAISYSTTGSLLPPSVYEPDPIDGRDALNRLAWLLVSPSRGLLVFCPYLVVIGGLLVGYRRHLSDVGLLLPATLSIAAYLLVFAAYNGWHAGSSFGPRYFSDVMPWFVLAGAMAVGGIRNAWEGLTLRRSVEVAMLAASFAWAIWVHGRGANVPETWQWNYLAQTASQEGAAKDWQHPQFLAGITFKVRPDGTVEDLP